MEYKNIWKKVLISGEQVRYEFSVSKAYNMACMILGCVGGIAIVFTSAYAVGVLVVLSSIFYFGWLARKSNAYAFTDKKVVIYRGWISSELLEIEYDEITEVLVTQNVIERMTNSGDLVINTAGGDAENIEDKQKIENIDDPFEAKKKLDEIRESSKK